MAKGQIKSSERIKRIREIERRVKDMEAQYPEEIEKGDFIRMVTANVVVDMRFLLNSCLHYIGQKDADDVMDEDEAFEEAASS